MSLIVIEGLDGAGKSTQIELLRKKLNSEDILTQYVHFPRTEAFGFGALISKFLRGEFGQIQEVDPYLVAMLYAGDRHAAKNLITGWLQEGITVILDRYVYSNIAYQCAKIPETERKQLKEWILKLEFRHFAIPEPDINLFLDVPLAFTRKKLEEREDGPSRSYLQGKKDIHEQNFDFQSLVREVYLESARTDEGLKILDCSGETNSVKTPEQIHQEIITLLRNNKMIP